jgi:hypothetical protein
MALLFVPLCVLVIDTGLVKASYAQLSETVQASAEDGALMIDQDAYRSSDGRTVILDQSSAEATVDSSMGASQLQGLRSWQTTVTTDRVTVRGSSRFICWCWAPPGSALPGAPTSGTANAGAANEGKRESQAECIECGL